MVWVVAVAACTPDLIDTTEVPDTSDASDASAEVSADLAGDPGVDVPPEVGGDAPDVEPGPFALPAMETVLLDRMATSTLCQECHSNSDDASAMRELDGDPVAPHDLWRGTMMAMAARDPFWLAMVEAEAAATPAAREVIEATCLRCHSPAAALGIIFPEQTTYLEWRNSAYRTEPPAGIKGRRCVACHMPADDEGATLETVIARAQEGDDFGSLEPRSPYNLTLNGEPASVRVRLVYQTLGTRFLAEVLSVDTPAMARFRAMYDEADVRPELIAEAEMPVR